MHQSHNMQVFTWFTSRVEATSTELCLYIITWGSKHSPAAPHMQLEIFWVTPHTAWSPSLLDLFSFSILLLLQYPLPLSQSLRIVQSLWIAIHMLTEPATGYSKIIQMEYQDQSSALTILEC